MYGAAHLSAHAAALRRESWNPNAMPLLCRFALLVVQRAAGQPLGGCRCNPCSPRVMEEGKAAREEAGSIGDKSPGIRRLGALPDSLEMGASMWDGPGVGDLALLCD